MLLYSIGSMISVRLSLNFDVRFILTTFTAFRDADANTTFSVFRTLEHLSSRSSGGSITLSNVDLIKTLIRLGAQPDALRVMDLDVTKESMAEDRRESLLLHLVSLVMSLSRYASIFKRVESGYSRLCSGTNGCPPRSCLTSFYHCYVLRWM